MKYYIADAFAEQLFKGNPAGVCILDEPLPDDIMQKIAAENNFSETAFVLKNGEKYNLRWFTPTFEIDLCGHATLASAFIVMNFVEPNLFEVSFDTQSGELTVRRRDDMYEMLFPERAPKKIGATSEITEALGFTPDELYSGRDLYAVVKNEAAVREYSPDFAKLKSLDKWLGIAVTAKGEKADFVSRFFCPELKTEDPVTGSAHSSLVPLWSEKLGKNVFTAEQLSQRGGRLYCERTEGSVKISGKAVLYLKGEINI